MSKHLKFPMSSQTQSVSPNLVSIGPALDKDHKLGAHRVGYQQDAPLPDHIAGFTDGHRLFVMSLENQRFVDTTHVFYFYVFGLIGLITFIVTLFTDGKAETSVYVIQAILLLCLIYAIIMTFYYRKKAIDQFVVFDRDTGNVLFTGRKKWPDLVVPFSEVGCFTDNAPGRGAFHFIAKLDCQMRPKTMSKGRRMELWSPMKLRNYEETVKQWAYVNRFMDKSKPIPRKPLSAWGSVEWFSERGITMDDVMNRYGYVENDPKTDWFKWDDTAPEHQARPEEVGV